MDYGNLLGMLVEDTEELTARVVLLAPNREPKREEDTGPSVGPSARCASARFISEESIGEWSTLRGGTCSGES
jgi:hypothetical protein